MAAGGLLAALVGYNLPKGRRGRPGSRRRRKWDSLVKGWK